MLGGAFDGGLTGEEEVRLKGKGEKGQGATYLIMMAIQSLSLCSLLPLLNYLH